MNPVVRTAESRTDAEQKAVRTERATNDSDALLLLGRFLTLKSHDGARRLAAVPVSRVKRGVIHAAGREGGLISSLHAAPSRNVQAPARSNKTCTGRQWDDGGKGQEGVRLDDRATRFLDAGKL